MFVGYHTGLWDTDFGCQSYAVASWGVVVPDYIVGNLLVGSEGSDVVANSVVEARNSVEVLFELGDK